MLIINEDSEVNEEYANEVYSKLVEEITQELGLQNTPKELNPPAELCFEGVWWIVNWLSSAPCSQKYKDSKGKTLGYYLGLKISRSAEYFNLTSLDSSHVIAHILQMCFAVWRERERQETPALAQ